MSHACDRREVTVVPAACVEYYACSLDVCMSVPEVGLNANFLQVVKRLRLEPAEEQAPSQARQDTKCRL